MATAPERLFALELLVERVRLEGRGPPAPRGSRLAVAFHPPDLPRLSVAAPPAPCPRPGLFPFGRGKSCLVRLGPAALVRLLGGAPLCALLLAPPAGAAAAPRLLGACRVSLATALGGHRGRYALRDHAGARVGDIALAFRLTELGVCPPGRLLREALPPASDPRDQPARPVDAEEPKPEGGGGPRLTGDARPGVVHPPRGRTGRDPDGMEQEMETDTFRPPPLFYTRAAGVDTTPTARHGGPGMAGEAEVGLREEAVPRPPTRNQAGAPGTAGEAAAGVGPRPAPGLRPDGLRPDGLRPDGLRRLPLLRELLRELALLDGQLGDGSPRPAWVVQDAATEAPEFPARPAGRPVRRGRERPPGLPPERDGGRGQVPTASPLRAGEGPEDGTRPEKARGARGDGPPGKKPVFGLTKTLRLRLGQANPEVLLLHERREQAKKKRVETLRGRKFGSPAPRGKPFRPAEDNWEPVGSSGPIGNSDPIPPWGERGGTLAPSEGEADGRGPPKGAEDRRIEAQTGSSGEGAEVANKSSPRGGASRTPGAVRSAPGTDAAAPPPGASPPDAGIQRDTIVQEVGDGPSQVKDPGFTGPSPEGNGPREASPSERYSDDFTSSCSSGALSSADAGGGESGTLRVCPELEGANPESADAEADSQASASGTPGNTCGNEGTSAPLPPLSAASWSPSSSGTPRVASSAAPSPAAGVGRSGQSDPSPIWGRDDGRAAAPREHRNTGAESRRGMLGCQEATRWARALETSQSLRSSLVSSYVPTSSMSEEEVSAPDSPSSILSGEGVDKLGSLMLSSQYKDIRELVIDKLPGYTV
ncbi:microtubule-associated protein 10 [Ornithorhynchus anatinus]|uniref:microtubule-associated protein 10 n=1 Tax=Ornithorhynchus anatinus TaxID=9258 RepID=UPI0019D47601|nr:microtubule-associated protein 10 [Ornithorhynchus anatinus]